MAANVTVIGRTARVHGRVTGAADIEVQGFVEGDIAVGGDVTIDASGIVGANVHGRRLVVRGAVRGDLLGQEAILLEEGARVLGDVRAPRVAIAPGALVRGYVQTGEGNAAPARAARTRAAARLAAAATAAPRPAAATPNATPAAKAPAPAKGAGNAVPAQARGAGATHGANAVNNSGPRRPPPPVVPALKKAKGQILKKKER
jgi:cytoskeletal protein CcmA (bactofilin family)